MKTVLLAATAILTASLCTSARAGTTGVTGGGQPFDNLQPSLAVTEAIPLFGIYPSNGGSGSALGDTLGFVYDFAGNFAPGTSFAAQGRLCRSARTPRCSACSAPPMAATDDQLQPAKPRGPGSHRRRHRAGPARHKRSAPRPGPRPSPSPPRSFRRTTIPCRGVASPGRPAADNHSATCSPRCRCSS